jgi:hypothetical protein
MKVKSPLQVALVDARANLALMRVAVKQLAVDVKVEREQNKTVRVAKVAATKEAKAVKKLARAKKAAQKRADSIAKAKARIEKAQAKIDALNVKLNAPKAKRRANRKASAVTVLVENGVAKAA